MISISGDDGFACVTELAQPGLAWVPGGRPAVPRPGRHPASPHPQHWTPAAAQVKKHVSLKILDQGHLHPKLEVTGLTCTGCSAQTGQNRVTWKTPSRAAFIPLQEPVAVLASCVPHTQTLV